MWRLCLTGLVLWHVRDRRGRKTAHLTQKDRVHLWSVLLEHETFRGEDGDIKASVSM